MYKTVFVYNTILILYIRIISSEISDKRSCIDEACSVPISTAETIMVYSGDDPRLLSFKQKQEVTIYSKSAGKKKHLWGVEINGKRGYVPHSHLKERKIFYSNNLIEVDTEEIVAESNKVPVDADKPSPDPVKPQYEIVAGTTLYSNLTTSPEIIAEFDQSNDKEKELLGPSIINDEHDKSKNVDNQTEILKSESQLVTRLSFVKEGENGEDETVDEMEIDNEDDIQDGGNKLDNEDTEEVSGHEIVSENFKPTKTSNFVNINQNNIHTAETFDTKLVIDKLSKLTDSHNIETPVNPEILEGNSQITSQQEPLISESNESKISIPHLQEELVDVKPELHVLTAAKVDSIVSDKVPDYSPPQVKEQQQVETKDELQTAHSHVTHQVLEKHIKQNILSEVDNAEPQMQNLSDNTPQLDVKHTSPLKDVLPDTKIEDTLASSDVGVLQDHDSAKVGSCASCNQDNHQMHNIVDTKEDSIVNGKIVDYSVTQQKEQQQVETKDELQTGQGHVTHQVLEKHEMFSEVDDLQPQVQKLSVNAPPLDVNQTSPPKNEFPDTKIIDTLTTSDVGVLQDHDSAEVASTTSSDFLSNMFPSSMKIAGLPSVNNDFGDKNKTSAGENLSPIVKPAEQINEMIYDNSNQNIDLTKDVDLDPFSNSVIEKSSKKQNGVSSSMLEDKTIIKDSELNEITDDIAQHLFAEQEIETANSNHIHDSNSLLSELYIAGHGSCSTGFQESDCPTDDSFHHPSVAVVNERIVDLYYFKLPIFTQEVFLVLIISAVTVVVFLWGYIYIDRTKKEAPLVAKINNLQKQFLILKRENELLTEKVSEVESENISKANIASNEIIEDLTFQLSEAESVRLSLEHQIQTLEKELENSTEVGLELNRMLSEFLNSDNGSDTLFANIDQLQRQLVEQQGTINTYNETLTIKETENHELRLELEINNSRVNELQSELNKMALNLLKLEEDKEQLQSNYETDLTSLKGHFEESASKFKSQITKISDELGLLQEKYDVSQRNLELKTSECTLLKENINHINSNNNNNEILQSMFDTTSIKAELIQLRNEKQILTERLQQENVRTSAFEKQTYLAMEDAQQLKAKYDKADQERMEAQTKLEILSNYFKEREAQLQKELSKQESMWIEKQGEATSTIEKIKYMQEELQNNKAQYESLKHEILAQEVDMKSQISVLEKKAHENWVAARQAERKVEDAKQEAAQLRNRLTLRERNLNDDKVQNRLVSPLEQNGDLSLNDTGTLPLMFGTREHLTTSPPLPGLPHFLPPPPGVPFMPPPLGGVPLHPPTFLPPPPSMIPGDHRPPPLGRMSSPPLNSRYSPDPMQYSLYSRNSPSPTSDDEYERPVYRSYSPYNRDERRDFNRPPPPPNNRNTLRNHRGTHSSGSTHSNESLEKINRHNSKV